MWRCDNVGGLGEHVKQHMLLFLRYTFLFFCLILRLALSPHKWTDFDDLYVIRGCAFWVSFILLTILGVKSHKNPYFGA